MAPHNEKSSLKRGRVSADNDSQDLKKPRRSERNNPESKAQALDDQSYLPTPLTQRESTATDIEKETTVIPDEPDRSSHRRTPSNSELPQASSSPPSDTQALSQFVYPPRAFADEVEDEAAEGVWGYLLPLDDKVRRPLVLRKRGGCEERKSAASTTNSSKGAAKMSAGSVRKQVNSLSPSGYLIGRHPECDLVINIPTVSNRHALVFSENRKGDAVAFLQDLSINGTFVNDAMVGQNKHRELEDGDEVTILDEARFVFRYPRTRDTNRFRQQYRLLQQLGKGHFATVYLCVERSTGAQYAVKVFEKRSGDSQHSQNEVLHQEIGILMGVSHPNLLCLRDTFDESDGVYLVLELAPEGELFNLIISQQKFSESETRCIFIQLFEGLKYLHDRGIIHRDIKPENILVANKELTVKLGDFGLAKIIGEDSFTTTLCGTPTYVAPEILQERRYRRYTKAVDVWSLGVVLYICLCGFPPFSDELYTTEHPYTLAQQIQQGSFDYPSPYWDTVGDLALDLIDRMLTVNVDDRITVDECLEHPWITGKQPSVTDSTDGLTGALGKLDFSKIDLCSPDPLIADISRQVFMREVAYAAFCGLGYLLIPGPKLHHGDIHAEGVTYYARAIQDAINLAPYIQFHIWMPMVDNPDLEVDGIADLSRLARQEFLGEPLTGQPSRVDPFGTWDAWDIIRRTCKYHSRLVVALSMPKHLPPMSVQSRWYSEPVHLLSFDANTFIKNQKGYPVLSKTHQALIGRFMRLRTSPWILLCDVGPIPGVDEQETSGTKLPALSGSDYPSLTQAAVSNKKHYDPTPHLSYLRNLQQRQPSRSAMERFGVGYQDYLQAPLQPLTVNLESITYEVFEKDPIKYKWYERAVAKALSDWASEGKPTSNPDGRVVVAVVGAGRGPLVSRALQASVETGVKIDLWAVEKNTNAFVLLQRHNEQKWGGQVKLVQSDMRSWKGPQVEKKDDSGAQTGPETAQTSDSAAAPPVTELVPTTIDILISELLGSFGDNELSPECLDGVTHLLNPVHGISIPASYTAHLTPIAAPKLHADVMNQSISNPAAPETPYVVMLHAIDFLSTNQPSAAALMNSSHGGAKYSARDSISTLPGSGEAPIPFVQTTWSFEHPNQHIPPQLPTTSTISNSHNVRRTRLSFPVYNRGVCHGLAGYFETVLYRDIELSTNPVTMDTKSADMISWFPIYFPLKTPLNVPDNGEVVVTMYRQTDDRKVWYEWMVEVFAVEGNEEEVVMSGGKGTSPAAGNLQRQPQRSRGGRRVRVGTSELHSSIKEGCLM